MVELVLMELTVIIVLADRDIQARIVNIKLTNVTHSHAET